MDDGLHSRRKLKDRQDEGFFTHVALAPVISFFIWFGLKVMDLIAESPATSNFSQQQKNGLGWILWVNSATLVSIDIADWLLVLAGVLFIVLGARWAIRKVT